MFVQTEFSKTNNNNAVSRARLDAATGDLDGFLYKDLDLISRFCLPICSRDNEIREVALDVISKTVEGWLEGVGSPKHYRLAHSDRRRTQNAMGNACACSDIVGNPVGDVPKEYLDLVALHLPIILRLSISCPFANVREKCQHILEVVQVSFFYAYLHLVSSCFGSTWGLKVNFAVLLRVANFTLSIFT